MTDTSPETPQNQPEADIADTSKDWWQSTTIRSALVAMLPSVARMLGFDDAAIAPYAGDIITVVFGIAAIYGRLKAQAPIKRG